MARAFVQQGVWRVQPSPVVDTPAQRGATLRVSLAAALLTLAISGMGDAPSSPAQAARPVIIAQPELVAVKRDDRVPSMGEAISPFRRRAAPVEQAAVPAAAETTSATRQLVPSREAEALEAGVIRSGEHTFRLAGIVPPEATRTCRRLDGLAVPCIDRAQSYLQLLIKGRAVACERLPQANDGPVEAHCRVGDADLGEQLVRQGWARAGDKPEERFLVAEAAARKQKLGIWRD